MTGGIWQFQTGVGGNRRKYTAYIISLAKKTLNIAEYRSVCFNFRMFKTTLL